MGATNSTTYYELSQFIGTDKPAWLQDYNGDMLKIDTGINGAKVAADNAANAASNAQNDATTAIGGVSSLNTTVGTLSGTVGTAVGNINTINSLIGNGTPTTTDHTIIGAINELNADKVDKTTVADTYVLKAHHIQVSSAADGTKTIGTQMSELVTAIKAAAAALADGEFIRVTGGFVYTAFNYPMFAEDYTNANNNINIQMTTVNVNTVPDSADFFTIYLNESACKMFGGTFGGAMSDTWTEESATIAPSESRLWYDVYKKL